VVIKDDMPESRNMSLKAYWKQKMIQSLVTVYGDTGVNLDKINLYLDNLIAKSLNPMMFMRNVYEEKTFEYPLDDVLKVVDKEKLIICANGTLNYRHDVKESELNGLLNKWLSDRKRLKNMAIAYEVAGDVANARKYDNLQNTAKEYINSSYGVSTMPGYILYSPDSASAITSQAREMISEMMFTLEKFLGGNMCFKNYNEFYAYVSEICNIELDNNLIIQYDIKVPTFDMLTERLKELLNHIPEDKKKGIDNDTSLFLMLKNIEKDPNKSINFYYRHNLYKFLNCNPKVLAIVDWIMIENREFNSPLLSKMTSKDSECSIYIEPLNNLVEIFMHFVVPLIATYDRVDKYQTRGRYVVPISDTDSVIVRLDEWIDYVNDKCTVKFDSFYDEGCMFRAGNIMNYIISDICNIMCGNLAKQSYVPRDFWKKLNMKNEFFFKSLLLYPNKKKNYSGWQRLKEGELVNKIANTGSALTGSNINPHVAKTFNKILSEEIHYVKEISLTRITRRVYELEKYIRNEILVNHNVKFGVFKAYKGSHRANAISDSCIRGVEIWNTLYPKNIIQPYNKVYVLNTILEREDQLYLIKDVGIREIIRKIIFKNPSNKEIPRFGLRTIAVPDTAEKYPAWIADIIDVNKLTEGHIKSITTLVPAIGLHLTRMSSTRKHISPLINL